MNTMADGEPPSTDSINRGSDSSEREALLGLTATTWRVETVRWYGYKLQINCFNVVFIHVFDSSLSRKLDY